LLPDEEEEPPSVVLVPLPFPEGLDGGANEPPCVAEELPPLLALPDEGKDGAFPPAGIGPGPIGPGPPLTAGLMPRATSKASMVVLLELDSLPWALTVSPFATAAKVADEVLVTVVDPVVVTACGPCRVLSVRVPPLLAVTTPKAKLPVGVDFDVVGKFGVAEGPGTMESALAASVPSEALVPSASTVEPVVAAATLDATVSVKLVCDEVSTVTVAVDVLELGVTVNESVPTLATVPETEPGRGALGGVVPGEPEPAPVPEPEPVPTGGVPPAGTGPGPIGAGPPLTAGLMPRATPKASMVVLVELAFVPCALTASPLATSANVAAVVLVTVVDPVVVTVWGPRAVLSVKVPPLLAVTTPKARLPVGVDVELLGKRGVAEGPGTIESALAARVPSAPRVPCASR
jgi:hypothetical protein